MNILNRLRQFNRLLYSQKNATHTAEDIYALQLISGLLQSGPFLPLNKMALRPFALAFLMNELVINRRKSLIEFGSGLSTILLARLIKSLGLTTKLYSVDENREWVDFVSMKLSAEGIMENVRLLHVPLEKRESINGQPHWYKQEILAEQLAGNKFDMVLVDGPTAFNKQIEYSRYFALPFIKDRLESNHVIFLDDASREGERKVLKDWSGQFGINFSIYGGSLGLGYTGDHFEANPIRYATITPV